MKSLLTVIAIFAAQLLAAQNDDLLKTEKWVKFFEEKTYLDKASKITDENFWDIDATYTYYDTYELLIIFTNGVAEVLPWQYDGLSVLIDKKKPLLDENFERVEKENIAYIVFDGYLLRNPNMGNSIAGDFTFVICEGPISIYREYYTSPITRDNIESGYMIYKNGKPEQGFYLGKFEKKAAKLVGDYEELAEKIRSQKAGYFNSDEDMRRIANEYNQWVKENNPYRYDDWAGLQIDW